MARMMNSQPQPRPNLVRKWEEKTAYTTHQFLVVTIIGTRLTKKMRAALWYHAP
jgi:hypothetical protein